MSLEPTPATTRFTKNLQNRGTERSGLSILLRDPRFQVVDTITKRRIIELLGSSATFGIQTFDLVMTPEPRPPITIASIDELFQELTMVEMKVTKKPIRNEGLNGFFFGATERERAMATALGDKYRFAFVVLSQGNDTVDPSLSSSASLKSKRRTRPWRVQYQVNFRTDLAIDDVDSSGQLVLLGLESDLDVPVSLESLSDDLGE